LGSLPGGSIPIVPGDLNIDFREHRNERGELFVDLLKDISLVDIDTLKQFTPH
jgi:hypothetical protein